MPAHAQRMSRLLASDKEFAPCRVERRAHAMRGERAWGDGSASGMCIGRARLKAVGARARAERTSNMRGMFVTLDVSKLSGWLNAYANCRVERRACNVGRGAGWEA